MEHARGVTTFSLIIGLLVLSAMFVPVSMSLKPVDEISGIPAGWSEEINLSDSETTDVLSSIAISDEVVHVVWEKYNSSTLDDYIVHKKSTDSGRAWEPIVNVSNLNYRALGPDIDVSGQNIHVVWEDYRGGDSIVYYRNSTDGGETWNPEKRIPSPTLYAGSPRIYVNNSNVHIFWGDLRDGSGGEIYYRRSLDGGISFDNGQGVDEDRRITFSPATIGGPWIGADGSNISVVWYDERDGDWEIYWMISKDNGFTWEDGLGTPNVGRKLTDTTNDCTQPAVGVNGSQIHIAWVEEQWPGPEYRIYYRNSTNSGVTWNIPKLLTGPSPGINSVDLAVNGSDVHVTWDDEREDGTHEEIYYKNSTDGGITWNNDVRLTYNLSTNSYRPRIAIENDTNHIIWDEEASDREIHYKRFPDFPHDSTVLSIWPNPHDGNVVNDFVLINATIDESLDNDTVLAAEYRVISPNSKIYGPYPMTLTTAGGTSVESFTTRWDFPLGEGEGNYLVEVRGQDDSDGWNLVWMNATFDVIDITPPLTGYRDITPPNGTGRDIGTQVEFQATYEDITALSSATLYYWNASEGFRANSIGMSNVSFAWNSSFNILSGAFTIYGAPGETIFYEVDVEDSAFCGTMISTTPQRALIPLNPVIVPMGPYPVFGYTYQYNGTSTGGYAPTLLKGCTVEVTWWNTSAGGCWSTIEFTDTLNWGEYSVDILNYSVGTIVYCNLTSNPTYNNLGYAYAFLDDYTYPGGIYLNIVCGIPYDVEINQPAPGAVITPGIPFDVEYTIVDRDGVLCPGYFTTNDDSFNISAKPVSQGAGSYSASPDVVFDGLASPDPGHYLGSMTVNAPYDQWEIIVAEGGTGETYPYLTPWGCWWLDPAYQIPGWSNDQASVIVDMQYTIALEEGWNLVSLPLIQTDESIDQVLSSIAGKWDCIQTYDPLSPEPWKTNNTLRPNQLNDFSTLNHKQGFWINITEPGGTNLTISGLDPSTTLIPLYAGWNLVGYPTLTEMTVANALWGTGADKVEVFDPVEPYRIKEVGPNYLMKPVEGYWVHVPVNTVWIVNW